MGRSAILWQANVGSHLPPFRLKKDILTMIINKQTRQYLCKVNHRKGSIIMCFIGEFPNGTPHTFYMFQKNFFILTGETMNEIRGIGLEKLEIPHELHQSFSNNSDRHAGSVRIFQKGLKFEGETRVLSFTMIRPKFQVELETERRFLLLTSYPLIVFVFTCINKLLLSRINTQIARRYTLQLFP